MRQASAAATQHRAGGRSVGIRWAYELRMHAVWCPNLLRTRLRLSVVTAGRTALGPLPRRGISPPIGDAHDVRGTLERVLRPWRRLRAPMGRDVRERREMSMCEQRSPRIPYFPPSSFPSTSILYVRADFAPQTPSTLESVRPCDPLMMKCRCPEDEVCASSSNRYQSVLCGVTCRRSARVRAAYKVAQRPRPMLPDAEGAHGVEEAHMGSWCGASASSRHWGGA